MAVPPDFAIVLAQYLFRLAELELIDRHQRMVERRPVVGADVLGHTPVCHQLSEGLDHIRGPDAAPCPDGQTLPGVLVVRRYCIDG